MIDNKSPKSSTTKPVYSFLKVKSLSETSWHRKPSSGFTIIELIVVVAIIGILATIGFFAYRNLVDKARVVSAKTELISIVKDIRITYTVDSNPLPVHSGDIGTVLIDYAGLKDPWGNFYQYHVPPVKVKANGTTLLNSQFDVYSFGKDGLTNNNITHTDSLDDIIRADDDEYIGRASVYPNP